MAGVDFNREVFARSPEQSPRQALRGAGFLVLVVVLGLFGFLGYKLISDSRLRVGGAENQDLAQVQQQMADMERRMEQLEKRHKVAVAEAAPIHPKTEASNSAGGLPPVRPAYRVSAASTLKPQAGASPNSLPHTQPVPERAGVALSADNPTDNHEVWEATTNRLADVVQVVGEQQGELSQTRDAVNQLLAQTRRTALSFELRRGTIPMPVGPVSLLLKSVDHNSQRYTVCVYLERKCIELKDRAVNEVVVFVLSKGSAPLELVATKVNRGEIVGYLEVPGDPKTR